MAAVPYPPGIRGQRTAARQVRNIATKGKSDATACRSGLAQGRGPERFRLAAGRPLSSCCLRFFSSRRRTCRAYPSPDVRASPFSSFGFALRTSILPALTGMSTHPAIVSVAGWTGIPPVSGKKGFSVKRQTVQHTNFSPQEQKQGGASAPPCPYSLVLCRHIRPACPVCYP